MSVISSRSKIISAGLPQPRAKEITVTINPHSLVLSQGKDKVKR